MLLVELSADAVLEKRSRRELRRGAKGYILSKMLQHLNE